MFNLQPDKILQLGTKYVVPDQSNTNEWPDIIKIE